MRGSGERFGVERLEGRALFAGGSFVEFLPSGEGAVIEDLTTDAKGNVYVSGRFADRIDVDPASGRELIFKAKGQTDAFVAKYTKKGALVWAKQLGGGGSDHAYGVAVDAAGNVGVVGVQSGSSASSDKLLVAKFTKAGKKVFAKLIGSGLNRDANSCAFDAQGNLFVGGQFGGDLAIGGTTLSTEDASNAWVAKFTKTGGVAWAKSFGGDEGLDVVNDLATDKDGNLYLGGFFTGEADFDAGGGSVVFDAGAGCDGYAAKWDGDGNFVWAEPITSTATSYFGPQVEGIAVDKNGNVAVTGKFRDDLTAGATTLSGEQFNDDIFAGRLDAAGNFAFAVAIGGTDYDSGEAVAFDAKGNVYVAGYYGDTVDLDPGAGKDEATADGSVDGFVLKLTPDGKHDWADSIKADFGGELHGISVDPLGYLVTGGKNEDYGYLLRIKTTGSFT